MKPKERFLNYALLNTSASCEPSTNPVNSTLKFEAEIPIDLSCKRPSPPLPPTVPGPNPAVAHFASPSLADSVPGHYPPEWSLKYSRAFAPAKAFPEPGLPNTPPAPLPPTALPLVASGPVVSNSALFQYLLLNPHHPLHPASALHHSSPSMMRPMMTPEIDFPFRLSDTAQLALYQRQLEAGRMAQSEELTSSTTSSPTSPQRPVAQAHSTQHDALHRSKSTETSHVQSAFRAPKRSHSASPVVGRRVGLKKSNSYPNLPKFLTRPETAKRILTKRLHSPTESLRRSKSEDRLHRLKIVPAPKATSPPSTAITSTTDEPKSIDNVDVDEKLHDFEKENTISPKSRFHRHFRKEVIESWDNENRQSVSGNALDLRTSPPFPKLHSFSDKLNEISSSEPHLGDIKQPIALPIDIYRQYYYYLMQEPGFASRAAAIAMAESYANLLNNPQKLASQTENKAFSMVNTNLDIDIDKNNTYRHLDAAAIRTSPDSVLGSAKTELRSADTTNGLAAFDRKRISRPLTGKHVRHGTGASPATLVGLRNMIQARQKLREIGRLDQSNRFGKAKNKKAAKRK